MALNNSSITRRSVVKGAAGLGLVASAALGTSTSTRSQDEEIYDYSDHPAVGVWFAGGPTFEYDVVHADGTFTVYNPWMSATMQQLTGFGDSGLPLFGFGVWRPVGERVVEAHWRVAWGDASVNLQGKLWYQVEVSEDGSEVVGRYRITVVDPSGNVVIEDAGPTLRAQRLEWEPFETPEGAEGTPEG